MPKIVVDNIRVGYEREGDGEPLILVPYLAADRACYAYQVADYARYFTCYSLDLRGTGETDGPQGPYSVELFADDVAAFMEALHIRKAHVAGLSLGAAVAAWLAAKHPGKGATLSLHSFWPKTDPFLATVVRSWQVMAERLRSVPETVIRDQGAVSAEAAEAMAQGAIAASEADIAVSITGIAGPGGATAEKPVGLVHLGLCRRGEAPESHRFVFPGDRAAVRLASLETALDLLAAAAERPE